MEMRLPKPLVEGPKTERMSNASFRIMVLFFGIVDFLYPHVARRAKRFGISEGMTVVDYGCGPGRYTVNFASLVGERGKVYALDIHELAIQTVERRMAKRNVRNVQPILVEGYHSTLPDETADVVCAIDMFFIIKNPTEFLAELKRIAKRGGLLVIDDGHQPRSVTKQKILDSGLWDISEETPDHLKCRPRHN
jgi:ubiquinone/menaquinone biosynthesis C-methylase UbiE